jgi:hypothetical protein
MSAILLCVKIFNKYIWNHKLSTITSSANIREWHTLNSCHEVEVFYILPNFMAQNPSWAEAVFHCKWKQKAHYHVYKSSHWEWNRKDHDHVYKMLPTVNGTQQFIIVFTRYFPIQSRWISSLHFCHTAVISIYILPSPLFLDLQRELLSISCLSKICYAYLNSALHVTCSTDLIPGLIVPIILILLDIFYVIQAESKIR